MKPFGRRIVVGRLEWRFKCGRGSVVILNPRTKKKVVVDFSKITGRSWDDIERGCHKRTQDGSVTPKHVSRYILENLVHI